jgi:hypothetical protein
MLIVVEGPDGAGKSTLIESARQKKEYFVRWQSSGPPPDLKTVIQVLFWLSSFPKDVHVVCDRIPCISDRVYGPILRGIDLFEKMPLDFGLGKLDTLVYCRPPTETLLKNATEGTHLEGVRERQEQIVQGYDALINKLAEKLSARVIEYDFTKESPVELWKKVFSPARR